MAVTHIVFDLGRVLIDFDHRIAAAKIAKLTVKTPEQIYAFFFDSQLTRRFEEGEIEPQAFYAKVRTFFRLKLKYEQFVPIWNEIFFLSDSNRRVRELARGLAARYDVSILSNINVLHYEYIKQTYDVFDGFSHVFTSCELGCVKPDQRIYARTLKLLGVSAGSVFYTDDRPELIEKARTMGFRAYVFTGPGQLVKDLARCGIVPDAEPAAA